MADINAAICRLCLEVICKDGFVAVENINKIQNVLSDVKLTIMSNPVICNKCNEALNKSFYFKSICLESEEHIKRIHNEKKLNLENDSEKTCRLCLQIVDDEMFCTFDIIDEDMLNKYLPELDLTLYPQPVLCFECVEELQNQFNFIISCLDVENRIRSYCATKNLNFLECIDLYNVLMQSQTMEVDNDSIDFSILKDIKGDIKEKINDGMLQDIKEEFNGSMSKDIEKDIKEEISEGINNAENVLEFKDDGMQVDNLDIAEEKIDTECLSTSEPVPSKSHIENKEVASKMAPQLVDHDYQFPEIPPKKEGDQQFDKECLPQQHLFKGYYNNINCLDQKLKYYQEEFQRASKKFNSLKMLLMKLKNEQILSEKAFKKLMECR